MLNKKSNTPRWTKDTPVVGELAPKGPLSLRDKYELGARPMARAKAEAKLVGVSLRQFLKTKYGY